EGKFPGRLLFLEYVIQTLVDDFERTMKIGLLHKSIAKSVLSCDYCSSNIKEIALFQKMLSIAVEVDKSPNCNADKIAAMVFSSVLNLPKRCQRDAFLSSMECDLLRCKVLELIFQHSTIPTDDPLSLRMILHFLQSFSLPIMYQDNEAVWQGWDEMLHHLLLLLLSYRNIVIDHLRIPVCERINLIIKDAKPKLQSKDCIKESDIKCRVQSFQKHLSKTIEQPIPSPIKEKIELLQVLLLTALEI
ncbi:hypothetical protein JD844_012378, partial [Phrynosoma platyrhinos]